MDANMREDYTGGPVAQSHCRTAPKQGNTMLKVIATVVRRSHIAHEDLVKAWEEVHAPHVVKMPYPLRYHITFFDSQQGDRDDRAPLA